MCRWMHGTLLCKCHTAGCNFRLVRLSDVIRAGGDIASNSANLTAVSKQLERPDYSVNFETIRLVVNGTKFTVLINRVEPIQF